LLFALFDKIGVYDKNGLHTLLFGTYCQVYPLYGVMHKMPNNGYKRWPIITCIMQLPFKFQSTAHQTGQLI